VLPLLLCCLYDRGISQLAACAAGMQWIVRGYPAAMLRWTFLFVAKTVVRFCIAVLGSGQLVLLMMMRHACYM
jgi:hypothetical protein